MASANSLVPGRLPLEFKAFTGGGICPLKTDRPMSAAMTLGKMPTNKTLKTNTDRICESQRIIPQRSTSPDIPLNRRFLWRSESGILSVASGITSRARIVYSLCLRLVSKYYAIMTNEARRPAKQAG